MSLRLLGLALLALAGCTRAGDRPAAVNAAPVPTTTVEATTGWQALASAADAAAIAGLAEQWTRARAAVPTRFRAKLAAEGALLDPAAAQPIPAPPPGPYRCRLVRLGGRERVRSFPPDFCYVDGDGQALSFTKQTGSNLPGGWLHPDGDTRMVFLGTARAAGEATAPGYGTVAGRDVAAVVERVAPFRWRMVMTRAGRGALLDVYELVPVVAPAPAPAAG